MVKEAGKGLFGYGSDMFHKGTFEGQGNNGQENSRLVAIPNHGAPAHIRLRVTSCVEDDGRRNPQRSRANLSIAYPCIYGIDMANQEDLVAARLSIEEVHTLIRATTLGYLSLPGVARAIDVPMGKFCRACFDGEYPIEIPPRPRLQVHAKDARQRQVTFFLAYLNFSVV